MLSNRAIAVLNDPRRIEQRDLWFSRLSNLFDGVQDPYLRTNVMTIHGVAGRCAAFEKPYIDPQGFVVECLEDLSGKLEEMPFEAQRFVPPCVEYHAYMVHFIDKILGADVYYQDGQWNTRYLSNQVGDLALPDIENNSTWLNARLAARAFVEQEVALPLFGLPTLSSAINIAVNLYGQEILLAMLTEPEAARHDLDIIQTVIEATHKWYLENLPHQQLQPVISWSRTQPPGYGQFCGCTTHLVSRKIYEEYFLEKDDGLLALYPKGGMIHLCGSHTQHIPTFAGMPHLRAIQMNDRAAMDLDKYFLGLRRDQIIYVNPCDDMPVRRIMEITRGERIVICKNFDSPTKPGRE